MSPLICIAVKLLTTDVGAVPPLVSLFKCLDDVVFSLISTETFFSILICTSVKPSREDVGVVLQEVSVIEYSEDAVLLRLLCMAMGLSSVAAVAVYPEL